MLSPEAKSLLNYLVSQLKAGYVKPGKPETYLSYSNVHNALGLSMRGQTVGQSLEHQGMRELAEWIYEKGYPAITGVIITQISFMPGRGYFEVYGKKDEDFAWWESEIRKAADFNWEVVDSRFDNNEVIYPDDVPKEIIHKEGASKTVRVNIYERDVDARRKCIAHYGFKCAACGVSMEQLYGVIGMNYIHVHHLVPISSIGTEYIVDPIKDLRPVCPNCHSMIHRDPNNVLSIEQVKVSMFEARKIV
ncbi:HNH endonuclease [Geomonas sp. RF6]|uniref:HNH endonuclease n=1 Tax=Geomonas sp. RF6 TaxID=2897342 RepID=UPI001E41D490|nr:HNH endonuclease [Geomonas sp. RF6]UFS69483.1 HNH endonuclease [Geomonas sp. RF6]